MNVIFPFIGFITLGLFCLYALSTIIGLFSSSVREFKKYLAFATLCSGGLLLLCLIIMNIFHLG